MGYSVEMNCECMEKPRLFNMGVGMLDANLGYQREIVYCKECKSFRLYEGTDVCNCGGNLQKVYTMQMLQEDIKSIICPRCGNEATVSIKGLWD